MYSVLIVQCKCLGLIQCAIIKLEQKVEQFCGNSTAGAWHGQMIKILFLKPNGELPDAHKQRRSAVNLKQG